MIIEEIKRASRLLYWGQVEQPNMVPCHNFYSVDVMTRYHGQDYIDWGPRMCDLTRTHKKPW